ncbi:hypothetical protein SAMN02745181_0323 [Rubritalea squalenifaciens DSM 18772]|uniref:Uncharacterized protein n=1 Tax=Rubritalea squalenifaciens DSM 18772 TaxID=1123071 RepID=A0A1M6BW40_9BACT|nr:hypothetical protein [Rubritalea squalenifaciens]SHI52891.1 hypothetical protein SAMN02745181_0323 [Rubritalea squalenifaciens DSM 18772]
MQTSHIQKLIDDAQFVDLFDDNAEESFYGYIIQQSEELIQLEVYDSEGRSEGTMILDKEDVSRIRWGHTEATLTEQLIGQRVDSPSIDLQSLCQTARSISQHYGYLCLTLGSYGTDKMYIGQIHEDEEESLIMHEYGTRARHERSFLLLSWGDVTRVQAGGIYEHNLHQLYH